MLFTTAVQQWQGGERRLRDADLAMAAAMERVTEAIVAELRRRLLDLRRPDRVILIVEHDEMAIRTADEIIDLGPGAGAHGGEIVAQGTLEDILASPASLTVYTLGTSR